MRFARRITQVQPSITLSITAIAKTLKAEGKDICSFSAGEPDFDTPTHIKAAAIAALNAGKTRYGAVEGEIQLREAIAAKLQRENHLSYSPQHIIVTNGGKHSLYNAMMVLIEAGDEVIIPAPYWLSYPEMVRLAEGIPKIVPTDATTGYKLTPDMLRQAITPQTRLLILNSPSNPAGIVYTPSELKALAETIVEHDLLVISDEIYEHIVYDGVEQVSIASFGKEIFERTLISNGFAKAYAMTGWRIGYLAAPLAITKAVSTFQGHSTSNVCMFAQYGAIAALNESQASVATMRQAFAERRKFIWERVSQIPGVTCAKPDGAFYLFADISKTGLSSVEFCEQFLREQQVAAIPGLPFGDDRHIRLSYATDLDTIATGIDRLEQFVGNRIGF
jgi:aspartate aminotransferase